MFKFLVWLPTLSPVNIWLKSVKKNKALKNNLHFFYASFSHELESYLAVPSQILGLTMRHE